jgi:hypothetical protein
MQFGNRINVGCLVVCVCVLSVVGTACSGDTDNNEDDQNACTNRDAQIEVAGTWTTNFGSLLVVDGGTWQSGGTSSGIVSYDNCENRVITEGGSSYSKIVWTEPSGGQFWFCTAAFGESSEEAARNAEVTADFENPSEMGSCGDFSFTKATEGNSVPDTGMGDVGSSPDAGN